MGIIAGIEKSPSSTNRVSDAADVDVSSPGASSSRPYCVAYNSLTGQVLVGDVRQQTVTAFDITYNGEYRDIADIRWRFSPMLCGPSTSCADREATVSKTFVQLSC
jgi:hypothetical protein